MEKLYLIAFILILNLSANAQETKQLYPVKKGETVTLQIENKKSKHSLWPRLIKNIAVSSAIYQADRSSSVTDKKVHSGKGQLFPAIGIGAFFTWKNFKKPRKKPVIAGYRLYNEKKELINVYQQHYRKRSMKLTTPVNTNGYIEPFVAYKGITSSLPESFSYHLSIKESSVSGKTDGNRDTIVTEHSINSTNTVYDVDEPVLIITIDGVEYCFFDFDGDGWIDRINFLDGNTINIVELSSYPGLNESNFTEVMSNYDPNIWPGVEEYLSEWVQGNNPNPPPDPNPPIGPCTSLLKSKVAGTTSFYNGVINSTINTSLALVNTSLDEMAFTIEDSIPHPRLSDVIYGTPNSVTFYTSNKTLAIGHTHPEGSVPAPSATDLYTLGDVYGTTGGLSQYSYVWAADGSIYALQVTDPDKLYNFLAAYPKAANLDPTSNAFLGTSKLAIEFDKARIYYTSSGLNEHDSYEKAFAYVLSAFNTGVSIQKADNNNIFSNILTTRYTDATGA